MLISHGALDKFEDVPTALVPSLPDPRSFTEPVIVGSFSHSYVKRKFRTLEKDVCLRVAQDCWITPSWAAREYLTINYAERRRAFGQQAEIIKAPRPAPALAIPGLYDDMVYADIRATYWSILKLVGWDVDYWPGRWLFAGMAPLDFPWPEHKLARNSLFSSAYPSTVTIWDGTEWKTRATGTKHYNFGLIALMMDIMQVIARKAERLGAVYVNADGYIIPQSKFDLLAEQLSEIGLEIREKGKGQAHVKRVAAYSIGDIESAPYRSSHDAQEWRHYGLDEQWLWGALKTAYRSKAAQRKFEYENVIQ